MCVYVHMHTRLYVCNHTHMSMCICLLTQQATLQNSATENQRGSSQWCGLFMLLRIPLSSFCLWTCAKTDKQPDFQ